MGRRGRPAHEGALRMRAASPASPWASRRARDFAGRPVAVALARAIRAFRRSGRVSARRHFSRSARSRGALVDLGPERDARRGCFFAGLAVGRHARSHRSSPSSAKPRWGGRSRSRARRARMPRSARPCGAVVALGPDRDAWVSPFSTRGSPRAPVSRSYSHRPAASRRERFHGASPWVSRTLVPFVFDAVGVAWARGPSGSRSRARARPGPRSARRHVGEASRRAASPISPSCPLARFEPFGAGAQLVSELAFFATAPRVGSEKRIDCTLR